VLAVAAGLPPRFRFRSSSGMTRDTRMGFPLAFCTSPSSTSAFPERTQAGTGAIVVLVAVAVAIPTVVVFSLFR
jgi:hypothetical protein